MTEYQKIIFVSLAFYAEGRLEKALCEALENNREELE
jgi:hypothetical protein